MVPQSWSAEEFIALAEEAMDEAEETTDVDVEDDRYLDRFQIATHYMAKAQIFATLAAAQATIEHTALLATQEPPG